MAEIVYILINDAMPGFVKIGFTAKDVEQRIRELDSSGLPLPFECFYAAKVNRGKEVEKTLHDIFKDYRVRPNREFFRVDPDRVRSAISLVAIEEITPKIDLNLSQEDLQALADNQRRQPFRFSLAKVPLNSELQFTRDESKTCRVIDDKYVEFNGQAMSLSGAAQLILKQMGYKAPAVQGPLYWSYKGKSLVELRRTAEEDSLT